jgi:uncharacterized protein YbcI
MATDAELEQPHPDERPLSVLAQVSNEMVRLYKEQFGRGPTRVRADWCGDDVLSVVLEDTLTPAERHLAALGEHERLRETRMFFQYATVHEFCEPVERLTGRKVRSFISGMDSEVAGLSIESFVFYPVGREEGSPSRTEIIPPPIR